MSSKDYSSTLLHSVQGAFPNIVDSQILKTLFPSLLLALVARNTNIILHTSQPAELQRSTAKILSAVFGLQVKRVKVRSQQSPRRLVESLFVSNSPRSSSPSSPKRRRAGGSLPRSPSAPRPSSSHFTEGSDSAASRLPHRQSDTLLTQNSDSTPGLHLPQVVVVSHLERASKAAQLALAQVLLSRRVTLDAAVWNLPDHFFVVYVSPLGDGYERPAIHTALLDHFAFSITLPHSAAPPPTSSPSPRLQSLPNPTPDKREPLLPYNSLPRPETAHISPLVSHYINALITVARHHPELDGTLLTARCMKDAEKLVRSSSFVFREDDNMTISEIHVRRVVPTILAHRLRVRDGPREQIMGILWEGASVRNWGRPVEVVQQERRTIKAILAEAMAEV